MFHHGTTIFRGILNANSISSGIGNIITGLKHLKIYESFISKRT